MRAALAALLIPLLICAAGSAQETNLAANGGFEELRKSDFLPSLPAAVREFYAGAADSPFEKWAFGGKWDGGDYAVRASDDAHTGKHSCQITCRTRGRGGIACAPMKFLPGTILKVSFWMKAKDAGGRMKLNFEGSPGDGWAGQELRAGTFDWTKFTKRVIVSGGKAGGEQTIVIFLYTLAEGDVWIDDFSVETVDVNAMAEAPDEPAAGPRMPKPIPEPAGSPGYRVSVVPALEKVFREDDFAPQVRGEAQASAARNEYESIQIVIEAPWRPVAVNEVRLSDLAGPAGAVIPASALQWNRVDYVETVVTPPYYAERGLGWYPDPLMPPGPFAVEKLSRTPVWITLKTPADCPAGQYRGTITIVPEGLKPTAVPVTLTVWDFALPRQTHLRTMTWLGDGVIRAFYGYGSGPDGDRKNAETVRNYETMLLEHRLGPGGEVAGHVPKAKGGAYDFARVDARLERLIGQGMNAFIMGTAPNLRRQGQKEYSPEFVASFTEMVKAYAGHLREKGWLDMAYVYTYDEAPRSAWPEVKKIARAVKDAAPEVRILQCLNQPEGVKELTGFVDVFDVYIAQYHKAGVAESQKKGAEVWLAVCCYPMDHPNFFLEYPLLDVRAAPWFCWKYGARGFEYWSVTSWGANWQRKGDKWPKADWVANAFGRYNGDGYMVYPGPDGQPLSSIRFEALRDGFEDYEYLWMLDDMLKRARKAGRTGPAVDQAAGLLTLEGVIRAGGAYAPAESEKFVAHRATVAAAIVQLGKILGDRK